MPFSYEITPESRLIHVTWDGIFTLEEVNSSLDGMYSDPKYVQEYRGIADVRSALFLMNLEDSKKNHEFVSSHPRRPLGPWAVVCTEPLQTALALLYERADGGSHPLRVFSSFEAATQWLDKESES